MQLSALSPQHALLTDTEKRKQPRCYFAGEETMHLNNPKCAAGGCSFSPWKKVGCLIRSHCRSPSPPDVVSCYVRNTSACKSRSMGQAEGQRAARVLMTAGQRGAAISRLERTFPGRGRNFLSKSTTGKDVAQIHTGRQITHKHAPMVTLEIGHGNSKPGSQWPCGWDRSHDSTPEKLSCLSL